MMHKKRGYNRETLSKLYRDYKLFAIACEGRKTEPQYFKIFQLFSTKIKVDIIEEKVSDDEMQTKFDDKSAPKWVLDRAMKYIEKVGLIDEDDLWFVIDVDKWSNKQIVEIVEYCNQYTNWHIVLSNPCFEVWLYFHKKTDISSSKSITSQDFKKELSSMIDGGYNAYKIIQFMPDAIKNAKASDSDLNHHLPKFKETKVYRLGDAIMQKVGTNDFNDFCKNKLPELKYIITKKYSIKKEKK